MKQLITVAAMAGLLACNNSKKEKEQVTDATTPGITDQQAANSANSFTSEPAKSATSYLLNGNPVETTGSLLVSKDKDKLKAGANYIAMLTATGGPNKEILTLNFLLDTKPGTYPVVGMGLTTGGDNGEVYGGLLGGKPKLTEYNVTITECKDLGDNGLGGHKWSISGSFEPMKIPAMKMMLLDKTKNHPAEARVDKANFSNLVFDDNTEQIIEEGMKKLKESKK